MSSSAAHRFRPPSDHNAGWGAKLPVYRQKPRTAGLPDDRKHAPRPARSLSPIPVPEVPPPTEVGDAILSDYFLYSTLGGSSSTTSDFFTTLTYPLIAETTTNASKKAVELSGQIDDETGKVAAYDELLAAVNGFQTTLAGFDFSDEAARPPPPRISSTVTMRS